MTDDATFENEVNRLVDDAAEAITVKIIEEAAARAKARTTSGLSIEQQTAKTRVRAVLTDEQILGFVERSGGVMEIFELVQHLGRNGVKESTTRTYVHKMVRKGKLANPRRGVYTLPAKTDPEEDEETLFGNNVA